MGNGKKNSKEKKKKANGEKRKKVKKKVQKKEETETESTSEESTEEEKKPKKPAVLPVAEKRIMPGALTKPPEHPPWFKRMLFEEERPDMSSKCGKSDLENEEIELLDTFMREREDLIPGDLVIVNDNLDEDSREYSRYEVLTKYNEGRYSAIYIVAKQTCSDNNEVMDKCLYAMKVGVRKESSNTQLRFKRELAVLRELKAAGVLRTPYLFDSGRVCERFYIVMTLFDKSLEKLKENVIGGVLRPSSVYHLAGEALAAIEEVHGIGYIHRDIKPSNFCIGVGTAAARLFLIDFGETVKNGKNIKYGVPDAFSLPYWAIDSHKKTAASPKIDVESWFYTFIEMLYPEILTWKKCQVEPEVLSAKIKFWEEFPQSVPNCPPQIAEAAKIINGATDKLDYNELKRLIEDAKNAFLNGAPLTLEWVKEMPKTLPKRGDYLAQSGVEDKSSPKEAKAPKIKAAKESKEVVEGSGNIDEWKSAASTLMQKFRFRTRRKKISLPIAIPMKDADTSTSTSTTADATAGLATAIPPEQKKSEKPEETPSADKKPVEEPKETLFQRISFRKKKKPMKADTVQEQPKVQTATEKPEETPIVEKKGADESKETLFQRISFRKKRKPKADTVQEQAKEPTVTTEKILEQTRTQPPAPGEVEVDPSKKPQPSQEKGEGLLQLLSLRVRRKKTFKGAATNLEQTPRDQAQAQDGATATATATNQATVSSTTSTNVPKSDEDKRTSSSVATGADQIQQKSFYQKVKEFKRKMRPVGPVVGSAEAKSAEKPEVAPIKTTQTTTAEKTTSGVPEKKQSAEDETKPPPKSMLQRLLSPTRKYSSSVALPASIRCIGLDSSSGEKPSGVATKQSPSEKEKYQSGGLLSRIRSRMRKTPRAENENGSSTAVTAPQATDAKPSVETGAASDVGASVETKEAMKPSDDGEHHTMGEMKKKMKKFWKKVVAKEEPQNEGTNEKLAKYQDPSLKEKVRAYLQKQQGSDEPTNLSADSADQSKSGKK
ncbi:hypothetical protein RB195_016649 [Necator americanus]|uniref:non-specific serine/threonine protein kinase n=1 Tax=Necator americanus TaxID=51031 RepID=A0ABR1C307_NECAM